MAVTIHDVAKKAGVSSSTVSRVISGKVSISKETSNKIKKVMKELDYHPNSQARNLATGSSSNIGLVINTNERDNFSNVFFNSSVFGIEKVVQEHGFNLLITNNLEEDKKKTSVEKLLFARTVDGLILPPTILTEKLIKEINQQKIPFVVLGEPANFANEVSWVDINNSSGSVIAVSHLYEMGYKNIAYFGGNESETFSENRMNGYKNSLRNTQAIIKKSSNNKDEALLNAKALLKNNDIDAVICNDNILAFALIKAAKELNIKVPKELGIVTFDNYPLAEYTDPQLTAIVIDTYSQGELVAKSLFESLSGTQSVRQSQITPSIILRESTQKGRD